ncbi:MAG: FtsX-like permease family protein [Pirellulales bacterium]
MSLGRVSIRELRSRPLRALLTFLSIVIGVAAVVSVFLTTGTTRSAQRQMLQAVSGKADLEIVANSPKGFTADAVKTVREMSSVRLAAPSLNRFGVIYAGDKSARARILGVDPAVDREVRDYEVVEGRAFETYSEVMMDRSFAKSLHVKAGDKVRIQANSGMADVTVVGLVEPRGGSGVAVGASIYSAYADAVKWFRAGRNVDQIQIVAKDSDKIKELREDLQSLLPEGVTVQAPATHSQMADELMFSTQNGLHMSIAFALLISLFIIYNTFEMSVGERRKQLGIMRAIGTTRGQVRRMILRESLLMSVAASGLGCAIGIYGAGWLLNATQQLLQVETPAIEVTALPLVVGVAFGILISLLGAYLPARRAADVQPLEAIRGMNTAQNERLRRVTTPLFFLSMVLGTGFLGSSIMGSAFLGADVVGIIWFLLGGVFLIPVVLPTVSEWLMALMRPALGASAMLAQRQLTRHLGRSTLTIGVLFIAVAFSIGMAGNVLDNVNNIKRWVARAMEGDFFVRASKPDIATGAAADLPDDVMDRLAAIQGIESLSAISIETVRSGEHSVMLIARDFSRPNSTMFELDSASEQETVDKLRAGQVIIGSVLAQRTGLKAGDHIPVAAAQGILDFEIAAVVNDYLGGGLSLYMDIETARTKLSVVGVDAVVILTEKQQMRTVESALRSYCDENGLILHSNADVVEIVNGMVNGVIACLWTLLALGCSIAAMGLVNTLTMNILEQTREIGMLRTVAMTRAQTRSMIFAQALMMGLLGIVPGAIVGVFVSYTIGLSSEAVLGHKIMFQWHPLLTIGAACMGMLIVLVASLIPAERAASLKLSAALQYE